MPVFKLNKEIIFPPPHLAEADGLLAVGGDLSVERLIEAYRNGIFPWFSEGDPILWWSPNPRLVLFPEKLKVNKRLMRYYRKSPYRLTVDTAFAKVIDNCATTRTLQGEETWILQEMKEAYIELHRRGYAHSVECWDNDTLVGGLYGLALDRVFFGESMFSVVTNSSKFALIHLVKSIKEHGIELIDCQMTTNHLLSFGAEEISGEDFHKKLNQLIQNTDPQNRW